MKVAVFLVVLGVWLMSLAKTNLSFNEFVKQAILLVILTTVMFGD